MKLIVGLLIALSSSMAFAQEDRQIKVNSFNMIERGSYVLYLAELCGTVTGTLQGNEKVSIVADPRREPGEYLTSVGATGNFCVLIRTLTGEAELSLAGTTIKASAKR